MKKTIKNIFIILAAYIAISTQLSTFAATDSLKYVMHSFLKIKTLAGKVICIDPSLVNEFADSVDILLITHEHSDHNDVSRVKRKSNCITIRAADALIAGVYQSFTIDNIKITAVPAYNNYHQKNVCVGYVVEFDSIRIYHAGDTGKIPEMSELTAMNITHAFLPMDGTYSMTPEAAAEAAAIINARYDFPIHTMPGTMGFNEQIVARFNSPNKVVIRPGNTISLTDGITSNNEIRVQANSFNLLQNYPNPFNPVTTIEFSVPNAGIPHRGLIQLKVYDVLGREVAVLVNEEKPAGTYKIVYNAGNLSSGVYFYKLTAGSFSQTNKFVLLR